MHWSWTLCPCSLVLMQEEVDEVEHKLTEAENSRGRLRRFCTKFCTPVFLEAFVLTFLAGEQLPGQGQTPALTKRKDVCALQTHPHKRLHFPGSISTSL